LVDGKAVEMVESGAVDSRIRSRVPALCGPAAASTSMTLAALVWFLRRA
jgi:hypothetical protein